MSDYRPIKRPKEKSIPRALLFLDTETREENINENIKELTFLSGCMIFDEIDDACCRVSREIFYLLKIEDFYEYLEKLLKEHNKITVFGHNLGFDLRVLGAFKRLSSGAYQSRAPIINQRIFMWTVHQGRKTIEFIDTANLGVMTVEQLGHDIGLPKLEIDFAEASPLELSTYCMRDCEIIERFILDYLAMLVHEGLGGFCETIASQAMHSFLYKFYDDNLYHHNIRSITELERNAYHGGRTEAFKVGVLEENHYYMLDINSMYPSIMRDYAIPYRLSAYRAGERIRLSNRLISEKYIIAECVLRTDEPCYPVLIDGFLCFPVGTFTATLHDEELRHAISQNHLLKIIRFAAYEKYPILRDYANFFLNKRLEYKLSGNASWGLIAKLFGNGLYGKLAQRRYIRNKIDRAAGLAFGRLPYFNHILNRAGQYIIWNGQIIDEYIEGYANRSALFAAGAITANGRMMLNHIRMQADLNHCYYCDTDSVIVDEVGFDNLRAMIDPHEPGMLKIENKADYVEIFGPKDYIFGDKIRMKGIKKKAIRLKDNRFEQWNFQSINAWLNSGGEGSVRLSRVIKERHFGINKGVIRDDGWILPYRITDSFRAY